jgi:hypothetical protein
VDILDPLSVGRSGKVRVLFLGIHPPHILSRVSERLPTDEVTKVVTGYLFSGIIDTRLLSYLFPL